MKTYGGKLLWPVVTQLKIMIFCQFVWPPVTFTSHSLSFEAFENMGERHNVLRRPSKIWSSGSHEISFINHIFSNIGSLQGFPSYMKVFIWEQCISDQRFKFKALLPVSLRSIIFKLLYTYINCTKTHWNPQCSSSRILLKSRHSSLLHERGVV